MNQKLINSIAVRVFNTSRKTVPSKCIEGCCYGNNNYSNDILGCCN